MLGYLMGIDLGTSSVKTLIIDEDGNVESLTQEEYSIDIFKKGWAEQNPENWWKATVNTIKDALQQSSISPYDIKGIGLSGQMHGMVLIDESLCVLRPAIIWSDQRTDQEVDCIYRKVGKEKFKRITLNSVSTGFQTPSLLWVKENEPNIYEKTYKVILPKDYIRLRLTGEVGTDHTDASSSLAYNTAELKWSADIIESLDLDMDKYPKVNSSYEIAGKITRKIAAETGLQEGTSVVFGGADQPMQSIGNGIVSPGDVSLTIGTGGQAFTIVDHPKYDNQFRTHTFCNALPGTWNILGATLSAGLSLKWLKNNILYKSSYDEITKTLQNIPAGSEGLLFLPYLSGERTPHLDSAAKGAFIGLTLKHTRDHMVKSVMEGVVYSLRDSLSIMKELDIKMDRFIASGGGSKSKLWMQIQADVLNEEIYRVETIEQASLGAAIMAGVGTGVYMSVQEATKKLVKYNNIPTVPIKENVEKYNYYYPIYRELYENNKYSFPKL